MFHRFHAVLMNQVYNSIPLAYGLRNSNTYIVIMRLFYITASLFFLVACGESNTTTTSQKAPEKTNTSTETTTILALGDSLTEGLGVPKKQAYPALLENKLHAMGFDNHTVVNSGLSGETSSGLKARIDWVLQTQPSITILTIGANDAMRGLPLDLVENNISEVIVKLQNNGSQVVLGGMEIYNNLGQEYVQGFKSIYPKLAQKHQVPLIPFFLAGVAGDSTLNQTDGIHPTSAGYQIIVDQNIWPAIQPLLQKQEQ